MHKPDSVDAKTLTYLVSAGSVRVLRAIQSEADGRWCLTAQVGMDEVTVRSKRDAIRLWASLDSIAKFCREYLGVVDFEVKGVP